MGNKAENIFTPGKGIEIVFNLESLSPLSMSSIIFDSDDKKKELIISQPTPPLNKSFSYKTIHITKVDQLPKNEKVRLGVKCELIEFIDNYKINNKTVLPSIKIRYQEKVEEVNIRTAFRIKPNNVYSLVAKILFGNQEFISGKHFRIFDVSLTGIGILIPKTADKNKNPLLSIKVGNTGKIGIIMKEPGETDKSPEFKKFLTSLKVVRINKKFNEKYFFAGCVLGRLERKSEEEMSKFIHKLQLFEIRHFQKM